MAAEILELEFYSRAPEIVARELLGKRLVSTIGGHRVSGIIVETEAYLAARDPACHGFRGRTPGNEAMFGPPGKAYVYPIHAKHCFNVVTGTTGKPCAVLIRAVEPTEGISTMKSRRGQDTIRNLCSGPAKLCQAFGMDRNHDKLPLTSRRVIWIEQLSDRFGSIPIRATPRIGVTSGQEMMLRFVIADSQFASGPRSLSRMP